MSRPASFPDWATGLSSPTDILEPSPSRKLVGFDVPRMKPNRETVNWLFRRVSEWLRHLADEELPIRLRRFSTLREGIEATVQGETFAVEEGGDRPLEPVWSVVEDTGRFCRGLATDGRTLFVSGQYLEARNPITGEILWTYASGGGAATTGGARVVTDGDVVVFLGGGASPDFSVYAAAPDLTGLPPGPLGVPQVGFLWSYNHGTAGSAVIRDVAIVSSVLVAVGGPSDGTGIVPAGRNVVLFNSSTGTLLESGELGSSTYSLSAVDAWRKGDAIVFVAGTDQDLSDDYQSGFSGPVFRGFWDLSVGFFPGVQSSPAVGPFGTVVDVWADSDAVYVATAPAQEFEWDLALIQPDDTPGTGANAWTIEAGSPPIVVATYTHTGAADPVSPETVARKLVESRNALAAGGNYFAKSYLFSAQGTKLRARRVRPQGETPDPGPLVGSSLNSLDGFLLPAVSNYIVWRLGKSSLVPDWRTGPGFEDGPDGIRARVAWVSELPPGDSDTPATRVVSIGDRVFVALDPLGSSDAATVMMLDATSGRLLDWRSDPSGSQALGLATDGVGVYLGLDVPFASGLDSIRRLDSGWRGRLYRRRNESERVGSGHGLLALPSEVSS